MTRAGARLAALLALAACGAWLPAGSMALAGAKPGYAGSALSAQALLQGSYRREVDLSAYAAPDNAEPATHALEGRLRISGKPRTRTVHHDEDFLDRQAAALARSWPDLTLELVRDGEDLLPAPRGYLLTAHPHWDVVLQPGRAWHDPADGAWDRAVLPFALVQKNMNCTHYGVLMFLFGEDGSTSRAAVQVSSETCHYLRLDLWGMLDLDYEPGAVAGAEALRAARRENLAQRIPTRPIATLRTRQPELDPARLAIGDARRRTFHGVLFDGVHYVSGCPTRHGEYPYCDELPFPSYSNAKSLAAGLALMAMEQAWPGTAGLSIGQVAPDSACLREDWQDVTLRDLADMSSGHFDATAYMADEEDAKVRGFFAAASAPDKSAFACRAYPRKAEPGATWVYHTSDTFLLGEGLTRWLRNRTGDAAADVFDRVLGPGLHAPLALSATARSSRRTADAARQPFFGFGQQFVRDDIVRLAHFVATGEGRIRGRQVLDPTLLGLALQRVPGQHGKPVASLPSFRYQLGFWARDVAPLLGCETPRFVPFMSGFGGIPVVLFPDGTVWYSVADSDQVSAFDWAPVAVEINKLAPLCNAKPYPPDPP